MTSWKVIDWLESGISISVGVGRTCPDIKPTHTHICNRCCMPWFFIFFPGPVSLNKYLWHSGEQTLYSSLETLLAQCLPCLPPSPPPPLTHMCVHTLTCPQACSLFVQGGLGQNTGFKLFGSSVKLVLVQEAMFRFASWFLLQSTGSGAKMTLRVTAHELNM